MKKAVHEDARDGPAVFRFKARLLRHPDATTSSALLVPGTIGKKLDGMRKVEGTINGHPFRADLEPNASGRHRLRVNKAMREGGNARLGDTVELAILGPEPEPAIPADLRDAFGGANAAKMLWKDLTLLGRRDWLRWIDAAKTAETRQRRIVRTVEQLSAGKRRPCCVNVYEFMLRRVRE